MEVMAVVLIHALHSGRLMVFKLFLKEEPGWI